MSATVNSRIVLPSSETSITASFNQDKHDNQAIILKRFFFNCGGIELQEESPDIKKSNIKEEIVQYVIRNRIVFKVVMSIGQYIKVIYQFCHHLSVNITSYVLQIMRTLLVLLISFIKKIDRH